MELDEYQQKSKATDGGTVIGEHYVYLAMGLAGESGELINKVKKIWRDDDGKMTDEKRVAIKQELGDVLWYTAQLAAALDYKLSDVAKDNLTKLSNRQKRDTIHGAGDER